MNAPIVFKRKFPRRKFHNYVGVLCEGVYRISQCAVIGEGGLGFLSEKQLLSSSLVVVSFKIPGDALVAFRGEVKNVRPHQGTQLFFHGIQFFSIPIYDRRKIRSYVSSRTQNEEVV